MAFLFSIVGDSNIRRHINKNSCRASPFVKACQVIHCGNLETFVPSLKSVRAESNVWLIAWIQSSRIFALLFSLLAPRILLIGMSLLRPCTATAPCGTVKACPRS